MLWAHAEGKIQWQICQILLTQTEVLAIVVVLVKSHICCEIMLNPISSKRLYTQSLQGFGCLWMVPVSPFKHLLLHVAISVYGLCIKQTVASPITSKKQIFQMNCINKSINISMPFCLLLPISHFSRLEICLPDIPFQGRNKAQQNAVNTESRYSIICGKSWALLLLTSNIFLRQQVSQNQLDNSW